MDSMPTLPTSEEIKQVLDYNPETGVFRWRTRASAPKHWNTRFAGKIAGGTMVIGYRTIAVNDEKYYAHRLAWLYMTGEWPPDQVDHINGKRADNRFSNLRLATSRENKCNKLANQTTRSGVKNVHWHAFSRSWHVRVMLHKREHSFGYFKTIEEAAEAAAEARIQLHGEFAPHDYTA